MPNAAAAPFERILDYAGLFPPAQLPFDQALRNYLNYRASGDASMLGRFVCPAARLGELTAHRDALAANPIALAVLGRGGQDVPTFFEHVRQDLADIDVCRETLGSAV